ncbi:ribonuclease M5 [Acididesulfobacillus acetoxydans]|uniref:Ribonuclease M5 n=1 Tax=Acididesulfobacillus acetoxydans TaxID=1561005 RepID=A0A8S0XUZ1_9FIRM|nr:ribonuclease M5 [Acididesulfobacillus acetoxydans]CAA7599877.1 ribonuclease M5 [Acididesulfobacillus acetoxydans]CEJ07443.1 Ribonuclease M5 [Acididesulfobacillus acetoxydans]
MIEQLIVVEGKNDAEAVRRALGPVDILWTEGYGLSREKLDYIAGMAEKRGVIIFTDPDSVGERIRERIRRRVPEAQHVFLPQRAARLRGEIGVENASGEEIRRAFARVQKVCPASRAGEQVFGMDDLIEAGLAGKPSSADKRREAGRLLGIGEANAKQFLHRLNRFGVSRTEFRQVIGEVEAGGKRAAVHETALARGGAGSPFAGAEFFNR